MNTKSKKTIKKIETKNVEVVSSKDSQVELVDFLSKLSLVRQTFATIINTASSYIDREDISGLSKKIVELDKFFVSKAKDLNFVTPEKVSLKEEVSKKLENSFVDKENGSVVVRQVEDDVRPKIKFK